ncbi:MAG: hypothetical protein HZB42_00525 [Sphingobacteriales bacterium]|nr:hypothetical protein [Sphingobacteriales bacterium]
MLLIFGILIKLPAFLYPHAAIYGDNDSALYKAITDLINPSAYKNPFLYPVLAFTLLFLQAIMLNRFINEQRMLNQQGHLPGIAYMLISSLYPEWNYFSAPLIANTILIYVLSVLFKTYNQPNAKGSIFNIGLGLGIISFLFFPAASFIIWILFALAIIRPFSLKEWMLCLLGLITPFYFYAVFLFVTDKWSWENILPHISVGAPAISQSVWLAGSAFLIILPFLTGGYLVNDSLRRMLIQVRKGWSILVLFLIGAFLVSFINNGSSFEGWIFTIIPFAAFHACTYLYSSFRIFPVAVFWLTVVYVLAYQYYGPGW